MYPRFLKKRFEDLTLEPLLVALLFGIAMVSIIRLQEIRDLKLCSTLILVAADLLLLALMIGGWVEEGRRLKKQITEGSSQ